MRTAIQLILMAAIFIALWTTIFGSMEHYFHLTSFAWYAVAGYWFYPSFSLIEQFILKDGKYEN